MARTGQSEYESDKKYVPFNPIQEEKSVVSKKCLNRRCVFECNVLKPKRSDGSKFSNIVDSKSEDGVMSDTPTNETTSSASIEALKCQSGLINFTDKLGKPHRRVFVPGVGWTSAKRAVVFKSEANVMS